jgi:voltage-gated potassium channel
MSSSKEYHEIKGNSFRNLVLMLSLYIVGSPFLIPYPSLTVVAHVLLTLALSFAIYTVQKQQPQRLIVMVLLLPVLVLYWLGNYNIIKFTLPGAYMLLVVYYALLIYAYFIQIYRSRKVTPNVLYAAFCLYLVIGLFWGGVYAFVNQLSPGAYSGALLEQTTSGPPHIFNYFSMVTLTTLGYGDITPQTAGAASLCQFEAVLGQFFTAVLVARLVGQYVTYKSEN